MQTISYTAAPDDLAAAMDRVCSDRVPIVITREGEQAVVMLPLDDYESLEETAHLLRSPANAKRLLDGISALEAGLGVSRQIELDQ